MRILIILCLFVLTSCDEAKETAEPTPPELVLTEVAFSDLPNWGSDDFKGFSTAFLRSCNRISKKPANEQFGVLKQAGTYGDWQIICSKFIDITDYDKVSLHTFFETYFTPYQISADNDLVGLFTGYYEASLSGSRIKNPPYIYPLHKRPDDLIMVQLGDFREHLKGERIAGRVINGRLRPYEARADIISGNWEHNNLNNNNDEALLWVDNAVDAFFVQIQGSGLVQMDDGEEMRIGYAGQNGHPYYAIGRELIKIGALTKENVSMQSIRAWLEDNKARADEIMNSNKSYVFFREITGDGAIGAEGVALTANRSLAIDRTLISYGLPLWVDIENPIEGKDNLRNLMIAQDTGGAIRGAVRGDVFWGHGQRAENMAGLMKSSGRYWALLPKFPKFNADN